MIAGLLLVLAFGIGSCACDWFSDAKDKLSGKPQ